MKRILLYALAILPGCQSHSLFTDRLIVDSDRILKVRQWPGGKTDTLAKTDMPDSDSLRHLAAYTRRDSVIESYFLAHGVDSVSTKEGPWWIYLQKINSGDEFFIVCRNTHDTLQIGPYATNGWAKIVADSGGWHGKSLIVGAQQLAWTWHQ